MVKMVDLFNIVEPDTSEEVENDNDELQELNEEDNSELRANDCLELENLVTASVFDQFPMTTCIRCAVHTFQLSVYDTLKKRSISDILSKAIKAAKSLKTQTYAAWLKLAILDMETRWNSTYSMLNRLLELRTFCSVNAKKLLNDHDWDSIQSLFIVFILYIIWLNIQMKLKNLKTSLSKKLLSNIDNRKDTLYLGLRYQLLMSEESNSRAVVHLIKTWELLNRIKNCFSTSTVETNDESVNNTCKERIADDTENEFQLYLDSLSNSQEFPELSSSTTTTTTPIRIILNTFDSFENSTKLPHSEDIITFWKNKKNEMPELYQLSKVLMAVPTTQLSVERLFSSLKFVLNDLRSNLGANVLEQIIILRSNLVI
ncbi:hypothetical protein QTP88_008407 [Uroleucon formosanum]